MDNGFLQTLVASDKPLTLGILVYIVYRLHKSDELQTKAIKWLRKAIATLDRRVAKLEDFNERKFPNEWRRPRAEDHDEDDF